MRPALPVQGNTVDAQLALGAHQGLYAGCIDGNAEYTPIEVIYSDNFGVTWSNSVDVTNGAAAARTSS